MSEHLLDDALHLVGSAIGDVVPPEAQVHLLNAQRELLLAIAVIIEHNRHRTTGRPRAKSPRKPSRVQLD